jgi:hypothetical protein
VVFRERLAATLLARLLGAAAFLRARVLVFFATLAGDFLGAFFRAVDLEAPAFAARVFAGVAFCRFVEPFRAEPAAFCLAAFLAIVSAPRLIIRIQAAASD